MARRTFLAEGRALGRLYHSPQHISGMTKQRLGGVNAGDLEALFGVEVAIIRAQPPAAFGNHANAAPGAICDLENLSQQLLRPPVAVEGYDALVGVFDFVPSSFQLR